MTARTALTPVQLVLDGSVADTAGTAIAGLVAAGATVADPPGPYKIAFIRVNNTTAGALNFTVRAGGSGLTASGAAAVAVPFEPATVGDLVVSVGATSTVDVGPLTAARFTQADGSLSLDFQATFAGFIWVYLRPYNPIAI